MKQSFINKIILCKHCRHAFIMNEQGNEDTCDSCLAEFEINHKLIDEVIGKTDDSPQT